MIDRQRITIAILALGGQGGGVLADWIVALAESEGWIAQSTSVPGVAQRTGSTVYYVELFPAGPAPVLALMPAAGDVDIVIASELMEAGRAILRGFVTAERTTLIASTSRIYAISEKTAMGNGIKSSERILAAAQERAARFVGFDMETAAAQAGSVISSVMFGALAGSGALPFARDAFEAAIRAGGKAIPANLAGFSSGHDAAAGNAQPAPAASPPLPVPTTPAGARINARILSGLPAAARTLATEGVRRLMDYQDAAYANLYLERLETLVPSDRSDGRLIAETARHLALWMSYEDVIRVADLKTRDTRFARVRDEVGVGASQLLGVTEFMHPRFEEMCETLPAGIGRRLLASARLRRLTAPLFAKGRYVRTSSIPWFMMLRLVAGLRRWRRGTLRYVLEQARITAWLGDIGEAAARDQAVALEVVALQQLVKGYGDTHARGLANFRILIDQWHGAGDAAAMRGLREAALADESGTALAEAIQAARERSRSTGTQR